MFFAIPGANAKSFPLHLRWAAQGAGLWEPGATPKADTKRPENPEATDYRGTTGKYLTIG
jgi:hypothetical protein